MLAKILADKRAAVAAAKTKRSMAAIAGSVVPGDHLFLQALTGKEWGLIAESKLASPVKGRLSRRQVRELAEIYQQNGATALSVLTDRHFAGCLEHIGEAKAMSDLPVLCKDFIIDEYQLYEARLAGADAVLLIAAILDDGQLAEYLAVADELGMDCLVEVHTQRELERVNQLPAKLVGINNRNLKDFTTDLEQTFKLAAYAAPGRMLVSESGIKTGDDVRRLKAAGIRGCLVGEALVRAGDIACLVRELS